jgi:hypothetical protein
VKRSPLVLLSLALLAAALAPPAGAKGRQSLDMYTAPMSAGKATELVRKGYNVTAIRHRARATTVDMVLTRAQAQLLRARGIRVTLMRNSRGRTARQAAAAQAQGATTSGARGTSRAASATSSIGWPAATGSW